MSRNPQITSWLLVLLCIAGALLFWPVLLNSSAETQNGRGEERDNPDRFYLQATRTNIDYHFTYDPLAADHWLFRTGGPTGTR
jgi:hypothetical protein